MKRLEELKRMVYVVDMINGFLKEGNMKDEASLSIVPDIRKLLLDTKLKDEGISFIKDSHNIDSVEFKKFPVHSLKGTSESEVIDELKEFEKRSLVYEKNSTSVCTIKKYFNDLKRMKSLEEIIFVGVCTDICVLNAALGTVNYLDQNNRNVEIYVPENMISTFDSEYHNKEEYTNMALKLMRQAGIKTERM